MTKELLDAVQDLEREYKDLRGELRSVSGEMLQKAESLGRELTDVSDEVRDKLKVEEPQAEGDAARSRHRATTAQRQRRRRPRRDDDGRDEPADTEEARRVAVATIEAGRR